MPQIQTLSKWKLDYETLVFKGPWSCLVGWFLIQTSGIGQRISFLWLQGNFQQRYQLNLHDSTIDFRHSGKSGTAQQVEKICWSRWVLKPQSGLSRSSGRAVSFSDHVIYIQKPTSDHDLISGTQFSVRLVFGCFSKLKALEIITVSEGC